MKPNLQVNKAVISCRTWLWKTNLKSRVYFQGCIKERRALLQYIGRTYETTVSASSGFTYFNGQLLMDNLYNTLTFDLGRKNELFYYS